MSIYNVDYKAAQAKDPSAHSVLAAQQDEVVKKAQQQMQTVQPTEKSEASVKIRDKRDDREKSGNRGRGKGQRSAASDDGMERDELPASMLSGGGLNFLA
jgi:hypothetical protein